MFLVGFFFSAQAIIICFLFFTLIPEDKWDHAINVRKGKKAIKTLVANVSVLFAVFLSLVFCEVSEKSTDLLLHWESKTNKTEIACNKNNEKKKKQNPQLSIYSFDFKECAQVLIQLRNYV